MSVGIAIVSANLSCQAPNREPHSCLVELLCASCLRFETDDLYVRSVCASSIPVGVDESPDVCLSRQIGFAVVPLTLCEREC